MRFWFHYNKPASRKIGHPAVSLHFKGICHLVDELAIYVPTKSKVRERQPFFVMAGDANAITVNSGKAVVL